MNTVVITIAMTAGVILLLCLYFKRGSKIEQLKAQVDHGNKEMEKVTDAIKKTNKVEAEAEKPETVPPAVAGDSASRLDRLNRL